MSQSTPQPKRMIDLRTHQRIIAPRSVIFSFKLLVVPAPLLEDIEGEGALLNLSVGGCGLLRDIDSTIAPCLLDNGATIIVSCPMGKEPRL